MLGLDPGHSESLFSAASVFSFLQDFFANYGYWAVLSVLLACGFGLPVPEDITLVAGGVIAALTPEKVDVHTMFAVSMLGVLGGDTFMFWLGRTFGERILQFRLIQALITPERYEKVQEQFAKRGRWVIFAGRFMPGLRAPIFTVAGISRRVSLLQFIITDGLAALVSVPIWVYLGYHVTRKALELGVDYKSQLLHFVHRGQLVILSALALGLMAVVFVAWRRRRKGKDGATPDTRGQA